MTKSSMTFASFGRRTVAIIIDTLILIICYIGISLSLTDSQIAEVHFFFLNTLYFIVFPVKYNGQTPGKKMMHIKIVSDDGKALSWTASAIREFGTYV